jgi:hypothetical protein
MLRFLPRRRMIPDRLAACAVFVAAVPLLFATSGCAVIKATRQPPKKDVGVLCPGVPRTHVIAELGAPVWSQERDGTATDVFAFKQGYSRGAKASRALLHGAADVATWGLWEVVGTPAETLANGTDVKVEVRYDPNQNVQSVTFFEGEKVVQPRPWFPLARRSVPPASVSYSSSSGSEGEVVTPVVESETNETAAPRSAAKTGGP